MFQFADVIVDESAFEVRRNGEVVALEPRAIKVLLYLIEHRERLVSKEELFQAIWGETFVTDNALTRVVAQLRKGLGDQAKQARYIETVPTQGYRFIAAVGPPREPVAGLRRRWWIAATPVLAFAAAVAGWALRQPAPTVFGAPRQVTAAEGLDVSPTFSPDGGSFAYASDRTGHFEIYIRPLDSTGSELAVTNDGQENIQPAWSPDGRYLAYYSVRLGGIRVIPALGGTPRTVTAFGCDPAWSPDSQRLVFRDGGFQSVSAVDSSAPFGSTLWTVPLTGGEPQQMTRRGSPAGGHGSPAWSPDGKRIAFTTGGLLSQIWVLTVEGGAVSRVPVPADAAFHPVFSPDGERLFYVGARKAMDVFAGEVGITGRGAREVAWLGTPAGRDLALSRDGRRIAYSANTLSSNLWVLPVDERAGEAAGPARQLTHDTSLRNTFPAVSPDGTRVAYHSRRKGVMGDVFLIPLAGGAPVQLTASPAAEIAPAWSSDGGAIFFQSMAAHPRRTLRRYSMADGSDTGYAEVGGQSSSVRLNGSGREFAFHQETGGELGLWIGVVGGAVRRLTPAGDVIGFAAWSGDGKTLAAERFDRDGAGLITVDLATGRWEAITRTPGEHWAGSWSPDGKRIAAAVQRRGPWNVWWIARDGSGERALTANTLLRTFVRYPAWSPAGGAIVYEQAETRGNIFAADLK